MMRILSTPQFTAAIRLIGLAMLLGLSVYYVTLINFGDRAFNLLWFGSLSVVFLVLAICTYFRRLSAGLGLGLISVLLALFAFELYASIQPDPFSSRLEKQLAPLKVGGDPLAIQWLPSTTVRYGWPLSIDSGPPVLPLTGPARVKTVMCSEGGRPVVMYEADQFGTNSNPEDWDSPINIGFVGDSFTYGNCVGREDHFVHAVRKSHGKTINLGFGGAGPLLMLASVREYIVPNRVKTVFWMYDENNDVLQLNENIRSDLQLERDMPILANYALDPAFSQNLVARQEKVNAVVTNSAIRWLRHRFEGHQIPYRSEMFIKLGNARALVHAALERREARRQFHEETLPSMPRPVDWRDAKLSPDAFRKAGLLKQYEVIVRQAASDIASYGGRMVFVIIPAQSVICLDTRHPNREAIKDIASRASLDIIDLEGPLLEEARKADRAALFAEPNCDGHFSELGYRVVGRELVEYLNEQAKMITPAGSGRAQFSEGSGTASR